MNIESFNLASYYFREIPNANSNFKRKQGNLPDKSPQSKTTGFRKIPNASNFSW